jgi:hypothetical protein
VNDDYSPHVTLGSRPALWDRQDVKKDATVAFEMEAPAEAFHVTCVARHPRSLIRLA